MVKVVKDATQHVVIKERGRLVIEIVYDIRGDYSTMVRAYTAATYGLLERKLVATIPPAMVPAVHSLWSIAKRRWVDYVNSN